MTEEPVPPAGLHPDLVRRLLDNLESNADFRAIFQSSPEKALRSLGYTDPWACMQFDADTPMASPEEIRDQRMKLEDALTSTLGMVVFKV